MDESVPSFHQVLIYGTLEVETTSFPIELNAEVVYIRGGRLIAGFIDNIFTGSFQLTLRGSHSSTQFQFPDSEVDPAGPIIGTKSLGMNIIAKLHVIDY